MKTYHPVLAMLLTISLGVQANADEPLDRYYERLAAIGSTMSIEGFQEQEFLLCEIAQSGSCAIPYLLKATQFIPGSYDEYDWALRNYLANLCKLYPCEFSEIIDTSDDDSHRWYAVYAVRQSNQHLCFSSLARLFNSNAPYFLRIQVLFALPYPISKDELNCLEPGAITILQEKPRPSDLSQVISLVRYAEMRAAVPYLRGLYSETKLYAWDGPRGNPRSVASEACEAIVAITHHGEDCDSLVVPGKNPCGYDVMP